MIAPDHPKVQRHLLDLGFGAFSDGLATVLIES